MYRNPVYHQVVFAILMLSTAARTSYLLRRRHPRPLPATTAHTVTRMYIDGTLLFLLGFLIWNLDNVFCDTVTKWKYGVKWPTAFLLEGTRRVTSLPLFELWLNIFSLFFFPMTRHRTFVVAHSYGERPTSFSRKC